MFKWWVKRPNAAMISRCTYLQQLANILGSIVAAFVCLLLCPVAGTEHS